MSKKPLGRSSGSLNAPIAAFTMAVVLCSYCVYSIGAARRGSSSSQPHLQGQTDVVQRRQRQDDWVRAALEEERQRKG
ncbi:uncharacterized protein BDV17DRAFT_267881 [Aspergillus undulatus]|uniref:uncharacterized protein n=1 Tax=Aspergillus undulatus TaxID=1810928 RepID=UPI003CCDDC81